MTEIEFEAVTEEQTADLEDELTDEALDRQGGARICIALCFGR